jgi:hypothetical protein
MFADFLEQAEYLVGEGGFKDAAAVIAGSTLESHLRQLCEKHDINGQRETNRGWKPIETSALNDALSKQGVYNRIEWRTVQGWLDLRNDAAHGHYDNYALEQVRQMIEGIRGFMVRHPA